MEKVRLKQRVMYYKAMLESHYDLELGIEMVEFMMLDSDYGLKYVLTVNRLALPHILVAVPERGQDAGGDILFP